jgi:hypothetical protein
MADTILSVRYGLGQIRNPTMDTLRDLILNPLRPGRAACEEGLIRFDGGVPSSSLIIIYDRSLGWSLQFDKDKSGDIWVSVGNSTRLSELVCPDDIAVPAGSFVTPEVALEAILHFCQNGERFTGLNWARLADLPITDEQWESMQ